MRLKDADELLEHVYRDKLDSRELIAKMINNATTIEEWEKGEWIIVTDSRGQHAECPYCGEWKYHSNQKFCGECGADMRGENNG